LIPRALHLNLDDAWRDQPFDLPIVDARKWGPQLRFSGPARLIDKFYRCLNTEGYLFVGHAESLFGLTDKFRMIHQNNGTAYQRIEATV